MAKNVVLTDDEIISLIKKSNLINLLVEGPDDLQIYNWIEKKINKINVSILPCGGRSTLIKVYNRRNEFNDKKVLFIADKDLWVFTGVPQNFSDIIFTTGYSIENDLFTCSTNIIYNLLSIEEKQTFDAIITNLLPWYCYEIDKHRNGGECNISLHLNQVIPVDSSELAPHYLALLDGYEVCNILHDEINADNYLKLRGKFIFDAIVRNLSSKNRRSKFSRDNVFELCLKMNANPHFDRIINEIEVKIT